MPLARGLRALVLECFLLQVIAQSPTGAPNVAVCSGSQLEAGPCPDTRSCVPKVDCEFGEWEDWFYGGGCSGLCYRHRDVRQYSNELGRPCSGSKVISRDCTEHKQYYAECQTPQLSQLSPKALNQGVDCEWGQWSAWSDCSQLCGGGEASRARHIALAPEHGGAACKPMISEEVAACNTQPCEARCVDGAWGPWGPWQPCPVTCSGGLQLRRRDWERAPDACGQPPVGSAHEFRPCGEPIAPLASPELGPKRCPAEEDPKACSLGDWEDWGSCDLPCGEGSRERRRGLRVVSLATVLESQIAYLRGRTASQEEEIHGLRDSNASLARENAKLLSRLSALRASGWDAAARKDGTSREMAKLRAANLDLRSQDGQLRKSILELEAGVARMRVQREALRQRNDALVENLTAFQIGQQEEAAQSPQHGDSAGDDITYLRKKLAESEREARDMDDVVVNLRQHVDYMRSENMALRAKGADLRHVGLRLEVVIMVVSVAFCLVLAAGFVHKWVLPSRRARGLSYSGISLVAAPGEARGSTHRGPVDSPLLGTGGGGGAGGSGAPVTPPSSPRCARGTLLASPSSPFKQEAAPLQP